MAAIYVHFPFCRSRCAYCGFYSQTNYQLYEQYIAALKEEIKQRSTYLNGETVTTIYFGGGTPSSLPQGSIETVSRAIRDAFHTEIQEFTVELNPDDVSSALTDELHQSGVNRVSMGIQTFNDELLQLIHRRHTAQEAIDAYQHLRERGFHNVSIDLILALPGQTLASSASDISRAISLRPEHISAYLLEYEEGTELWRKLKSKQIEAIADDVQAEMYYQMCRMLQDAGYEHYEISNFARTDETNRSLRSQHNSSYWNNTPYLGLGAAAHSYNRISRRWNVSSVAEYIKSTREGATAHEQESLNRVSLYNEMVMTRLRTTEGIRSIDMERITTHQAEQLRQMAKELISDRLLETTPDHHLKLTHRGLMLSDMVMSSLFIDDER